LGALVASDLKTASAASESGSSTREQQLEPRVPSRELLLAVTIVTDNGGPVPVVRFEAFIADHPELAHLRTRVEIAGAERSPERGSARCSTSGCLPRSSLQPCRLVVRELTRSGR
jgi:hypothetical protein